MSPQPPSLTTALRPEKGDFLDELLHPTRVSWAELPRLGNFPPAADLRSTTPEPEERNGGNLCTSSIDVPSLLEWPFRQMPVKMSSKTADMTTPQESPSQVSYAALPATTVPTFGAPTKLQSSFKHQESGMFIQPKHNVRPEHHRDYAIPPPATVSYPAIKAQPEKQFSSSWWNDTNPVPASSYASNPYTDWTDAAKASEDLKALLEGGIDDEEDEDENGATKDAKADNDEDDLAGVVDGIAVKLLPHQVEGVDWMRGRELGPVKRGKVPKGGILADDMGLGKTLQAISLIVSNPKPEKGEKAWKKQFESVERTTLVVAPLALLRQWEQEIKDKVTPSRRLKVLVHHGPQRTKRSLDLARYDVVITTYHSLLSEHGTTAAKGHEGCFGIRWFRVILDEAHTIKNRNAKCTKACYDLESEYRWCLTGTPMQNNRDELQSLIQFLRIAPYNDYREWKDGIEGPFKRGKGHIAIRRLHGILRCFMKRRTKDILKEDGALNPGGKASAPGEQSATGFKITERKVVTVAVQFSPAERKFYTRLEQRTDQSIEKMMKQGVNYANALVLLLRLRQACNHPRLTRVKLEKDKDAISTDSSQKATDLGVDALADMLASASIAVLSCDICGREFTKEDRNLGREQCKECFEDLEYFNTVEPAEAKKPKRRKSIVKKIVEEKVKIEKKRPKNRNTVIDSDDEEEANASWIVDGSKRSSLRTGKTGTADDEDAEGGGEWLNSEDLDDDGNGDKSSQYDSFVVGDNKIDGREMEVGAEAEFNNVSVLTSKVTQQRISKQEGADDSDEEDTSYEDDLESGVSESELDSSDSEADDDRRPPPPSNHIMASAKIRELVKIVLREAEDHKFIVFSQFTSMLDLVEPFFRKEGIKFTRYDGSMRNDDRERSLNRLRTDQNTRVLLCSLKCGSLGLNLTAATRVVILEPFWNPVSIYELPLERFQPAI